MFRLKTTLKAKIQVKLELFLRLLPAYSLFFIALFIIGILYKNLLGVVFLFIAFATLRYKYNDSITYHNDSNKKCIALSILLFAIASIPLIVFPIKISILMFLPIAVGITWLLYEFGIKKKLEKSVNEVKPFNLDTCTKSELILHCKEHNYNELKTEIAIKFFIDKEKPREVWLWLCETQEDPMGWDSIRTLK